jgi:hypothetical protein
VLVFFIHGVATKDAGYSRRLETLIKEDLNHRNVPLPIFYASFWGNTFKRTGQLWNYVHEDLKDLKNSHPKINVPDVFRYREFREDFISEFFGDVLTYFNTERGKDIRESICDQLKKFIGFHPEDDGIHIVTHSLGSVMLWDILFSDRFSPDDPAFEIRTLLNLQEGSSGYQGKELKSITTMGSPILFFNLMLDIKPCRIKEFTEKYQKNSIRWINIIHSSDIIAYPLQASLETKSLSNLFFRDKYICADANWLERRALTMGQTHTAMAVSVVDGHNSYWGSRGTARLVSANLMGDCTAIDCAKIDTQ